MSKSRWVWPDLELRCPCCRCVSSSKVLVNNRRKPSQTRRCEKCESPYVATPMAETGVDGDGVPFVRLLGLFLRPV